MQKQSANLPIKVEEAHPFDMNPEKGEFGKEFDPSYTIPKIKNEPDEDECEQKSILANTYEGMLMEKRPLTDLPAISPRNSLKRTFDYANTTPAKRIYRDTLTELHDWSLPKELLMLFQPLFCRLCMFQLSGNSMAKLHYQSKNHEKKIRTWLVEYSEKTGEPLHKKAVMPIKKKKDEQDYDPKHYYCEACDLALTGKVHAESHYMGKNHQRVVCGQKMPAGKGHYNDEGKWTRTKPSVTQLDNFGQTFKEQQEKKERKVEGELTCEVCNINVTSPIQLGVHRNGFKHKKKLKALREAKNLEILIADEEASMSFSVTSDVSEDFHLNPPEEGDILSSYRTPSGKYYCKTCNISLNSESQFMQHLHSKKHSKKAIGRSIIRVESNTPAITSSDDIFDHL